MFSSYAQENDFQFWSSLSVNDKVTYKTDIYLKHGLRFRENASILSKSFSEVKLKYKYNKQISVAVGFRDINEWNKELIRYQKARYFTDLYLRNKQGRIVFAVRNRYQQQGNISAYDDIFRQKLSVAYNLRKTKLEPSLAMEYFYTEAEKINKLRYTLTFSYPILNDIECDFSYRIQQQLSVKNPETLFIFEGKISYEF